jgi:DNA polymerase III subunit gamma/tau
MAFNLKYRPQNFDEFIGNSATVRSLKVVLQTKEKPNAYFFSGPSGCGKTTLARIIAKELECHENDIREYNMSNNRGIDTAREIISNLPFRPLYGQTKVYILDEIHKATAEFQNALLKAVEEPPEHVFFIFCTTEPNKVIKTIKNRCACFELYSLSCKVLMKIISAIADKEKIKLEEKHIKQIAKVANGSPRQATIILEQVKGVHTKHLMKSIKSYQADEERETIELCRALLNRNSWKTISPIIKNMKAEPESIRRAVLGYMSSVMLSGVNEQAIIVIEAFADNFYDSGKAGLILACYESIQ